MNENEILLDNIRSEIMDYIRQINFKKAIVGGYNKDYVMLNIQEICNIYEKQIAKIYNEYKDRFNMLNNEILELRQKNEAFQRRPAADPAVIEKANQAIAEANTRIEAANTQIAKLQAMYDEAEAKLKNQANQANYNQDLYRRGYVGQDGLYDARATADEIIRRANEEADRIRLRARKDADIATDVKNSASDIIRRANEEAERLRAHARNEAEMIIRDRRAEIRAEERLHEERLGELKDKYLKYKEFFNRMLSEVRDIESDIGPMMAKHDDAKAENSPAPEKYAQMSFGGDTSAQNMRVI